MYQYTNNLLTSILCYLVHGSTPHLDEKETVSLTWQEKRMAHHVLYEWKVKDYYVRLDKFGHYPRDRYGLTDDKETNMLINEVALRLNVSPRGYRETSVIHPNVRRKR